jgi:hypothetical protein
MKAKHIFTSHIYIVSSIQTPFIAIKITSIALSVAQMICVIVELGIETGAIPHWSRDRRDGRSTRAIL